HFFAACSVCQPQQPQCGPCQPWLLWGSGEAFAAVAVVRVAMPAAPVLTAAPTATPRSRLRILGISCPPRKDRLPISRDPHWVWNVMNITYALYVPQCRILPRCWLNKRGA